MIKVNRPTIGMDGATIWADRAVIGIDRGTIQARRQTIQVDRRAIWQCRRTIEACRGAIGANQRAMQVNRGAIRLGRHAIRPDRRGFTQGDEDFLQRGTIFVEEGSMINLLNRGFSKLPDDAFFTKVGSIVAALTGNSKFVTTDPTLAALQTELDALNQAMTMAPGQARDAAVAAKRRILEQMLENLADNLEKTANNDLEKLATTGFDLKKATGQSSEPPPIPQGLRLKLTGASGEVQLIFDASDRAKGYQVQTSPDPNVGPWTDYDAYSSSRSVILQGLTHAKDIWVRVRAVGPNNTKSGWGDPATILVS